jgi:Rrf2 family iron-sulfur cluster assembly transcriptional regulator
MRVTKWGEYGILICMYLASREGDGAVGAVDIAEVQKIPLQYTQQILQRLRKGGIIKSVRGPRGGYCLKKNSSEINLKEIFAAAEGDTFRVICQESPLGLEWCGGHDQCGLKEVWRDLKATVDAVLESKTLASILAKHHSPYHKKNPNLVQVGTR